jgi:hypothetical protein
MLNTGAAGVFTASEKQVRALQKKIPNITVDKSTAGKYCIRFGNNFVIKFTRTVGIITSFGVINFAIMPINTSFLFCFTDIKKYNVYLDNTRNVLVYGGRNYPIAIRNGHAWFLLDNLKGIMSHFIETELRQLHQRFGHPAANRLQRLLKKAEIKDIDHNVLAKINRICYQCQMHGGKPGRFRFTLQKNANFNYRVIVDVIFLTGKLVLYAINEAITFQTAKFLSNITAKTIWNVLRNIWINTYIKSPDVIIINAETNLIATKFVNNAKTIIIEIKEVLVEAHYSIGKIEKYHDSVKRAYEIIIKKLGIAISLFNALQMAIKSVNDTAGSDGLVPTLLVFGAYPKLTS